MPQMNARFSMNSPCASPPHRIKQHVRSAAWHSHPFENSHPSMQKCLLLDPLSMFKMLFFNFATKQIYSMTRRAKRTLGIAIESKQLYIHSELQRAVVLILDVTNVDLQCYDQTNVYGHEARKHISPLCFSNGH